MQRKHRADEYCFHTVYGDSVKHSLNSRLDIIDKGITSRSEVVELTRDVRVGLSREEINALLDRLCDSDDDSEAVDWEQLLTDLGTSSSSEEESDDCEPVRARGASTSPRAGAPSRTATTKKDSTVWIAHKDSDYAEKPPDFLGEHKVNVHDTHRIDYFLAVFPDSLLEQNGFQTNLCAVQKGTENLWLTLPELKVCLGTCIGDDLHQISQNQEGQQNPGLKWTLLLIQCL
ncbi:hypothetical protein MRX96_004535 [Rhipicephalus microplus]